MTNPIIQRELIGMLRTRRAFIVQLAVVAVLAMLVVLMWPADSQVAISGAQSQTVFRVFAYGLLAAIVLLAPVFPATAIVRERQQGTLALLLNSPMSPGSILTGKLIGVLGFVALLIVLSMPAAAACFTMGGIDLVDQLLAVYITLFVVALQYGVLALWVSSYAASPDSALRVTYGIILVLAVVTMGPHQFLQGVGSTEEAVALVQDAGNEIEQSLPGVGGVVKMGLGLLVPVFHWLDSLGMPPPVIADWLRCVSPAPAVMEAVGQGGLTSAGLVEAGDVLWRYVMIALVMSAVLLLHLWRRLGQRLLDRPRDAGTMTQDRSTAARTYRRFMFLWFFDPQSRSGLIQPGINPVMVKEFRCRRFGRGHWMMRMMAACVIASIGLMWLATLSAATWGVPTLGGIMVLLQVALIVLVTPALASGMIAGERETRGWDILRMTPMSTGSILRGKFLAAGWTLFLLLLATLPGYGIVYLIDETQQYVVPKVLLSLLLTAVFAVLLTAAVSSLFNRTAAATATAYALLVGGVAGSMVFWLGEEAPFSRATVEGVLRFNPLAATLSLIGARGFDRYDLVPFNWYFLGVACVVCIVVLAWRTWVLTRPQ